jgi:hypothetical protein
LENRVRVMKDTKISLDAVLEYIRPKNRIQKFMKKLTIALIGMA